MPRALLGLGLSSLLFAAVPDGGAIYNQRCAKCHDKGDDRTPSKETLAKRDPQTVVKALSTGSMQGFAVGLTAAETGALAAYLTGKIPPATTAQEEPNACAGAPRDSLSKVRCGTDGDAISRTRVISPRRGSRLKTFRSLK